MKTLGQEAYEGYVRKNERGPQPWPWNELPPTIQAAWEDCAKAVAKAISGTGSAELISIEELIDESYQTAFEHGWWEDCMSVRGLDGSATFINPGMVAAKIPEKLCLIHSEVSEALEEFRSNKSPDYVYAKTSGGTMAYPDQPVDLPQKPEGFLVELADVEIRIWDLVGALGLRDEYVKAIQWKLAYNKTRPYKHGGKKV